MDLNNAEEIILHIKEKTGKTKKEVKKLIEEKKERFSGLLTDAGAAFMVAKELKLEVNAAESASETLNISQLEEGMNNIDVLGAVKQVFSPRKFEKNGKKGMLNNLVIADESGEIRVTVWNQDVEKLEKLKIEKGTRILLKNCYVGAYNEKPQLNLGFNGEIIAEPEEAKGKKLPEVEAKTVKISELKEGMNNADVKVRVLRVYEETGFEKEGREGKVRNFEIGDGTGKVRATAWNDLSEAVGKLEQGQAVKIEGGYTKKGLKGDMELHLGWSARVFPIDGKDIPALEKLTDEKIEKKKIADLKEGDKFVEIEGEIISVQPGKLFYKVCPTCGTKVQQMDSGLVCEQCGEVKDAGINLVVGVRVEDGSGQIDLAGFGLAAEKLIGLSKQEFREREEKEDVEKIFNELEKELIKKKIKSSGYVRKNSYSEQLEFVAKTVKME